MQILVNQRTNWWKGNKSLEAKEINSQTGVKHEDRDTIGNEMQHHSPNSSIMFEKKYDA